MTRSVDQVNAAVYEIRSMPYGVARSTAAAAELDRVVAEGPDAARAYVLFALVESYVWGGEVTKAYLPFTQMLRWWDEHPEHFDAEDTHSLFWSFKWMVGHLHEFPTVPAEQIERTLEDMAHRYAVAGNGMNAVALERFGWARERGTEDVEETYQAWVATPRDPYSQCEACEPGDRASYLFETGRYAEGIRLLEQVLAGSPRCATEPGDMLSHLQLAYLEVGDAEAAARTHRRGLRHLDTDVAMVGPTGRHVEFLARSGNAERALRMLVEHQRSLVTCDSPGERLGFLTSVAVATRVLQDDHAGSAVGLREVPARTVAELDAWVRAEASDLARAFDERNGTTAASDRLRRADERVDRRLPVDLGVLGPSVDASADRVDAGVPTDDVHHADLDDLDVGSTQGRDDDAQALLAHADGVVADDPVRAARLQRRAATLLEASGDLDRAGFALAEAAQLAATQGDSESATSAFEHAVALLHAGGVPPRFVGPVVRAWARAAASTGTTGRALAALDRVASALEAATAATTGGATVPVSAPSDDLLARERLADDREARELRDTRARLLATAGDLEEAARLAEAVAEDYARAGEVQDAAHAFWLAGTSRVEAGAPADAVDALESAMEGFAIVGDRDARVRVADELVAVLRTLGRDDDAARAAGTLTR